MVKDWAWSVAASRAAHEIMASRRMRVSFDFGFERDTLRAGRRFRGSGAGVALPSEYSTLEFGWG